MTLVGAGTEVELTRERAAAVAEYLWTGALPGSVLGAARITDALGGARRRARTLEFESYEWEAVRGALLALGLLH